MKQSNQKLLFVGALILGVTLGGLMFQLPGFAMAQDRRQPNRKPVPSGALLSVPLLEKISTTLESIDERLERMEEKLGDIANKTNGA